MRESTHLRIFIAWVIMVRICIAWVVMVRIFIACVVIAPFASATEFVHCVKILLVWPVGAYWITKEVIWMCNCDPL